MLKKVSARLNRIIEYIPRLKPLPEKLTSRNFSKSLSNYKGSSKYYNLKYTKGDYIIEPKSLYIDMLKVYATCIHIFKNNGGYLRQMNNWLAGGNNFPLLTFFLGGLTGLLGGAISSGAGVAWGFFCAEIGKAQSKHSNQCLARPDDQLWMVEAIGIENKIPTHMVQRSDMAQKWVKAGGIKNKTPTYMAQRWIVDPFRDGKPGSDGSSWCISEDRFEITF